MNYAILVQGILGLLQIVIGNLKKSPTTDKLTLAISGLQAAEVELQTVIGTPVTFSQLEGLRTTKTW